MRQRFVEGGLERALNDRPRPGQRRKLNGKQEAHLVAVACGSAPEGHTRWTLQLLADRVVKLEFTDSIRRGGRSGRYCKKRTQTVAEEAMVHTSGERRLRSLH